MMNSRKKKSIRSFICGLLAVLCLVLAGCQQEGPFESLSEKKVTRTGDQLTFLKSKYREFDKAFSVTQFVTVAQGATIITGDDTSGYSQLVFKPGDLPTDTTIVFNWDSEGYISDLDPHGISFNTPVKIHLSYKDADLTGVNEDSLKIWYFDEPNDVWELIGGTVNKNEKRVEGFIEHFSRYGIAAL